MRRLTVTAYPCSHSFCCGDVTCEEEADCAGPYVRYEDYAKLERELRIHREVIDSYVSRDIRQMVLEEIDRRIEEAP